MKISLMFILFMIYSVTVQSQSDFQSARKININCRSLINSPTKFQTIKPYNLQLKKEWPVVLSSLSVFTAGTLLSYFDKTKSFTVEELNNLNESKINSFDRTAVNNWSPMADKISDYTLMGVSILPALFLVPKTTRNDFISIACLSLEVFAINSGTTSIIKNTVNRPRPYVYNTTLPIEIRTDKESQLSFYSGHTSHTAAATFLFAKVIHDYYPNMETGCKLGIWTFAVTVPALEGYLRVTAGKHFPTDAICGYAMGALTGFLIPELHHIRNNKVAEKKKLSIRLLPDIKYGMSFNMNARF